MSKKKGQITGQVIGATKSGSGLKGKRKMAGFSLFGVSVEGVDAVQVKRHLLLLILIAITIKFVVVFATTSVFNSFMDSFDLQYYLQAGVHIMQGQVPYANFSFDYPPLALIPILLALLPAILFNSGALFVLAFQILMVICDIIIVICVYLIGLKLYNEKTAFVAAFLYATAFSVGYFVLTKYDAFPTSLLMVAILFTLYGQTVKGYLAAVLGFFAKIFPALIIPFMVLYNSRTNTLKNEIVSFVKVSIVPFLILFIPFLIINSNILSTYLFVSGSSVGVYVNTATYTIYSYLSSILHLSVNMDTISDIMYICMGVLLLLPLYFVYSDREVQPRGFLTVLCVAIFSVVFFTKFHSPQYIVWYTPLLALLVADDLVKIGLFYLVQILAYIEFPLMFGNYYVNLQYKNAIGTFEGNVTLIFFTVEYAVLLLLFFMVARPAGGFRYKLREILSFRH
jgi:hypothetical protein